MNHAFDKRIDTNQIVWLRQLLELEEFEEFEEPVQKQHTTTTTD